MQPSQHPLRGGEYYKLAVVLGALTAMGPLAIDTYLPALPTIARDLQTSPALVQVSLSVYFVGIALGQAVYGPLSDRVGRKPALYLGLTLFIVASLGCALSPRVEALIVFRFLQALGGSSTTPTSTCSSTAQPLSKDRLSSLAAAVGAGDAGDDEQGPGDG